jgi:peroxiredoxin
MNCACVLPNLLFGPAPLTDDDFRQLKALNVTAILSLQTEDDYADGVREDKRNAALEFGLSFTNLPVTDFDRLELLSKLPKCVLVLKQSLAAGNTLYVHCTAGVNRSATVVVAYLHQSLQWPLEQALKHVLACRNCCPDEEIILKASS